MEPTTKSNDADNPKAEDCDDVPGDFFDDFLREDFMAGLDIVDEDGEDEPFPLADSKEDCPTRLPTTVPSSKSNDINDKKEDSSDIKDTADEKIDTDIKQISNEKLENNVQIPDKKSEKVETKTINDTRKVNYKNKSYIGSDLRRNDRNSGNKRVDKEGEIDSRRDPQKTKRDIQFDKLKREKDREKKRISEKLQLVETGLVPPGMEMEFDVQEIDNKNKRANIRDKRKSRSPIKRRSGKEQSREKLSPRKHSSNVNNRSSPLMRSTRRVSPRRSPLRKRSPLDSFRSREPYSKRSKYSPRHRRSRSRSPYRRREEKKSFLEEIVEKLNETNPIPFHMRQTPVLTNMQPYIQEMQYIVPGPPISAVPQQLYPQQAFSQPMTVPVPAPVPAPVENPVYQPIQQKYDPFDKTFFIGDSLDSPLIPQLDSPSLKNRQSPSLRTSSEPTHFNQPKTSLKNQQLLNLRTLSKPIRFNQSLPNQQTPNAKESSEPMRFNQPNSSLQNPQPTLPKITSENEGIANLFLDKKITLSDFLAITAKPEVTTASPADLREKIKVITRCQEAIRYLGTSEKKFSGRLIVHKSEKTPSEKYKSPLIKTTQCKIPFTEMPSKSESISTFSAYIDRLLQHVGVMDKPVDIDNISRSDNVMDTPRPPPPPQISNNKINSDILPIPVKKVTPSKRCAECDKRKAVTKSIGIQCDNFMTFSVSTQVSEEDFRPKFPKGQSLASLTPAQLLAETGQSSKFKDDFEPYYKKGFMNRNPYGHSSNFGGGRGSGNNPFS